MKSMPLVRTVAQQSRQLCFLWLSFLNMKLQQGGEGIKSFRQGKGMLKEPESAVKCFMSPNNSSLVRISHMAPPNYKKPPGMVVLLYIQKERKTTSVWSLIVSNKGGERMRKERTPEKCLRDWDQRKVSNLTEFQFPQRKWSYPPHEGYREDEMRKCTESLILC